MRKTNMMAVVAAALLAFAGPASAQQGSETREQPRGSEGAAGKAAAGKRAAGKKGQASGEIVKMKEVKLRSGDGTHQVVLLRTDKGQHLVVDLGDTQQLGQAGFEPREGVRIAVDGRAGRVGDRAVVFARSVEADGETYRIQREGEKPLRTSLSKQFKAYEKAQKSGAQAGAKDLSGQMTIQGEIVQEKSVKSAQGQGGEHRVVLIQRRDGAQLPVDLGPAKATEEIETDKGKRLSVTGQPKLVGGRIVLWADQVSEIGETAQIDRPETASPGSLQTPGTTRDRPGSAAPMDRPGQTQPDQRQPGQTQQPGETRQPGQGQDSPADR